MFSLDELGYLPFAQIRRLLFHLWHIALFGCDAEFGASRGVADIDQEAPINLDL